MYDLFIKYYLCAHCLPGAYLQEAPVIVDKPDIVYVMENQSVTITVTLNHVNAAVIWKRYVCLRCQAPYKCVFFFNLCLEEENIMSKKDKEINCLLA